MIVFVVTAEHAYTLKSARLQSPGPKISIATYGRLLKHAAPPRATYVFTDMDRLPGGRVAQAAQLYRQLREMGFRVLNDPARVPSRYGLLRKLHGAGINDFNAYLAEEDAIPKRWPVFLRAQGSHDGPSSDLLSGMAEVRQAIETAVASGVPISSLLLVEYAAEPVRPGLYRKLSMFRIGEVSFASTCDHEDRWVVKQGVVGIAPPDLYEDDLRIVRENPFAPELAPVFDLAAIEYGRADFGLVGGRVQIYEINSNPMIEFLTEHPSPLRLESFRIFKQNYFEALAKIDTVE